MELTQVDWCAYAVDQTRKDAEHRRRMFALNGAVALAASLNTAFFLAILLFDLMPGGTILALIALAVFPANAVFAVRTARRFAPHAPRPR